MCLPLDQHQVELWLVDFDRVDEQGVLDCRQLLDQEEDARHSRFLFERDRRAFAISHGFLRQVLSQYADVSPAAWQFQFNDHGRPEIASPAGCRSLRFNLSHTRSAALVGVVRDRDLGVDIEASDRDASCVELADRYFSPSETAELRSRATVEQRRRFFQYWTLKEAYIKARGLGLAIPLDQFSYRLPAAEPISISFDTKLTDDPATWQFVEWQPAEKLQAAAAVRVAAGETMRFLLRRAVPFGLPTAAIELHA
jgi:4'-phosphopantetheinyl transferase